MPELSDLPEEVLVAIFKEATPRSLAEIAMTSRRMRRISAGNEIWNQWLKPELKQKQPGAARRVFISNVEARARYIWADSKGESFLLALLKKKGPVSEKTSRALFSQIGIKALEEGLIALDDAMHFSTASRPFGPYDNLDVLLCDNGLIALRERLLTPKQAASVRDLQILLTDRGLEAMRERLITPQDAKLHINISAYNLRPVGRPFTPNGTPVQIMNPSNSNVVSAGPYANLSHMLTDNGLTALRERYISAGKAAYIATAYLQELLTDEGLCSLREGIVTFEQVQKMSRPGGSNGSSKLKHILSKYGQMALREKLITFEQMTQIASLEYLLTKKGVAALREGLVSPQQMLNMSEFYLKRMLDGQSLHQLREAADVRGPIVCPSYELKKNREKMDRISVSCKDFLEFYERDWSGYVSRVKVLSKINRSVEGDYVSDREIVVGLHERVIQQHAFLTEALVHKKEKIESFKTKLVGAAEYLSGILKKPWFSADDSASDCSYLETKASITMRKILDEVGEIETSLNLIQADCIRMQESFQVPRGNALRPL